MKHTIPISLAAAVLSTLIVTGCDNSNSPAAITPPPADVEITSTFIDDPVHGLGYSHSNGARNGKTDENGKFQCFEDQPVEFYVGNAKLGKGSCKQVITPIDLVPNGNVNDETVQAIVYLLQNLDTTIGDDRIVITDEVVALLNEALGDAGLDFSALTESDDPIALVTTLLASINTLAAAETPPIVLPNLTVEEAVEDFEDTLEEIGALGAGNISKDPMNPNANVTIARMSAVTVTATSTGGEEGSEQVHPILVSYAEQVIGDRELGDGSADIGDPTHVDDVFVSMSLDNGDTWKKYKVGKTADKSSTQVKWAGETIQYPGHSHKPTMKINGNYVMVAWHDKYCPSGNPLDLDLDGGDTDYFQVNGSQGSVDYTAADGNNVTYPDGFPAPNGKLVFEVPFSCIWTARGVYDTETNAIDWRTPQQLTSGRRDANKVTIAAAGEVGFAITWQEDRQGLRSGGGEGPGDGWSGATTNHGSDIWYSYLPWDEFEAVEDAEATPLVASSNLSYPTRISDNESCNATDTKAYCADVCTGYVTSGDKYSDAGATVDKCISDNDDPLVWDASYNQLIDGDTGASRPAFTIMNNDADEPVVIMAYEETKGLSAQATPDSENDIALEGKMAYFHSFPFANGIDVAAPSLDNVVAVEPGFAVNLCGERNPEDTAVTDDSIPAQCENAEEIYENARRVVLVTQVDPANEESDYNFAVMYKQGFDNQGSPSDMFIRMNAGFDETTFSPLSINVSSMDELLDTTDSTATPTWSEEHLTAPSWANPFENTFSPRGFIRENDIFIAFEYTPSYVQWEQGNIPNNFYVHRCVADGEAGDGTVDADFGTKCTWQGPQKTTFVTGRKISTLDPRFVPSAAGNTDSGLASDISNPDVIVITYGTFDQEGGDELDLFYTRSTDRGETWETTINEASAEANFTLAGYPEVEEKEVQTLVSPDGLQIYNTWLQESAEDIEAAEVYKALDVVFGLIECADLTTCPPPLGEGSAE